MACELREKTWQLGFTTGPGQQPRARTVAARHQERVREASARAKRRVGLPETAPVVRCDEAGRDGLWLHRFLLAHGMTHHGGDSSAIAVSRRQRRAKSDGLDVRKLLRMLMRSHHGEHKVWPVVQVPSMEAEADRHVHRDVATLRPERGSPTSRIKGVLSRDGLRVTSLTTLPEQRDARELWDGSPMPPGVRRRVGRVSAPHTLLSEQMAAVEAARRSLLQTSPEARSDTIRPCMQRKGIGINGSW